MLKLSIENTFFTLKRKMAGKPFPSLKRRCHDMALQGLNKLKIKLTSLCLDSYTGKPSDSTTNYAKMRKTENREKN